MFGVVDGVLAAVCCLPILGCATADRRMAVNVEAVDLRAQPHTVAHPTIHDPDEETQLLYGERVKVVKKAAGWAQVEAVEQPEFTHAHRWQGYPGWVPAAALTPADEVLSPTVVVTVTWAAAWKDAYLATAAPWRFALGTRLHAVDMAGQRWKVELLDGTTVWMRHESATPLKDLATQSPMETRRAIVRNAALLLGDGYYWGGRTPSRPDVTGRGLVTGTDCSGLVNLAYRAAGVDIPRDAHEQFARAKRIHALQPADLIFLSERTNPSHIVHVMLYAGEGMLLEAPGTGMIARRISVAERFKTPLDWLESGAVVDDQTVYFGTYLESPSTKSQ